MSKPRTYKRLLNSILHTRFLQATAISYGYHLAIAGLSSDFYSSFWALFWAFFPLSLAGIKGLLFIFCGIFIHIQQISSFSTGRRCFPSNWSAIRYTLLSISSYTTIGWYLISAFWFSEVFIYTSPTSKGLSWIIRGGYDGPDQLNESPVYLRFLFALLGFCQAIVHIYKDYSSYKLRVDMAGVERYAATSRAPLAAQLSKRSYKMFSHSLVLAAGCSVLGPFIYTGFFRNTMWSWQVMWARLFANIARSDDSPPNGIYLGGIMFTGLWSGILLVSMWEFTVFIFEYYMMQEPIKNGQPLSSSSRDPNGTLLTGLRSKAEIVQTFAFWEFCNIAEKHPDRRKSIFGDIDRDNQPPICYQMIDAALTIVKNIETRMQELEPKAVIQPDSKPEIERLPRILAQPVPGKSNIFDHSARESDALGRIANYVSQEAKRAGTSPTPWSPPIEETKRLAIEYTKPAVNDLHQRAEVAQQSPVGKYLLTTPTALIKASILGSPYAAPAVINFAVQSATKMLVASLAEDTYGKAIQSVPPAILTFTQSIFAIRSFVGKHTSGRIVSAVTAKQLDDVVGIHDNLKLSLKELLSAFQMFLNETGLPIHASNDARRAADLGPLLIIEATNNPVAQGLQDRKRMEMEELNNKQKRSQRQAPLQPPKESKRLFKQLDHDRETKKNTASTNVVINPLSIAGSMREPSRAIDNPLLARDYNTLPTGGLSRRRVEVVR